MIRASVLGLFVASAAVACTGASPAAPDAGISVDAAAPDASADHPACVEFGSAPVTVPAHVETTLAGADLVAPQGCASVDAPYGVESAGIDRVIPLAGLTVGKGYVVKLTSPADLAFYVTTGCGTDAGPDGAQCLLFEDATSGQVEVGRFVASGPMAFVVVDFYASQSPGSTQFMLDVYEEQCRENAQCGGTTPACSDGLCVACVSSYDCTDPAQPRCDVAAQACTAGVDGCTQEDAAEPRDDGPAGARLLVPDIIGRASATSSVCSSPQSEVDLFAFDVTSLGETWELRLGWSGGRDLDLELFDARGGLVGVSYWEQAERIALTYLPVGRYYASVQEFATSPDATPVPYTISAQRTNGVACTAAADCAREYRNQVYRGTCEAGACVSIAGAGALPEGAACDSQSDCAPDLSCPSFFFVADADTRDRCARRCDSTSDCGEGDVCTTYLEHNFCVAKCTTDAQCPTAPDREPPLGQPWYRMSCEQATGRCLP